MDTSTLNLIGTLLQPIVMFIMARIAFPFLRKRWATIFFIVFYVVSVITVFLQVSAAIASAREMAEAEMRKNVNVVMVPYQSQWSPTGTLGLHGSGAWLGRDYSAGCGATLYAPISGTVARKGRDSYIGPYGAYNTYIVIRSSDGRVQAGMMHGHYTAGVGDEVIAGKTAVGTEANEGNSTHCHTHLSILVDGVAIDPRDAINQ